MRDHKKVAAVSYCSGDCPEYCLGDYPAVSTRVLSRLYREMYRCTDRVAAYDSYDVLSWEKGKKKDGASWFICA